MLRVRGFVPPLVLVVALAWSATSRPPVEPPSTAFGGTQQQAVRRLHRSADSWVQHPLRAVFGDSVSLARFWQGAHDGGAALPLPAVDFTREMVIAVATGFAPSTGHRITVEGVAVDPDRGVVVTVGLVVAEGIQGMWDAVATEAARGAGSQVLGPASAPAFLESSSTSGPDDDVSAHRTRV